LREGENLGSKKSGKINSDVVKEQYSITRDTVFGPAHVHHEGGGEKGKVDYEALYKYILFMVLCTTMEGGDHDEDDEGLPTAQTFTRELRGSAFSVWPS